MKNLIRIVALVGASALVLALGVTAFAHSNPPSVAPATPTMSPSDDPSPEPTQSPSEDHGQVGNDDDGQVEDQNEGPSGNDDDGDIEDANDDQNEGHNDDQSGNDDKGQNDDQNEGPNDDQNDDQNEGPNDDQNDDRERRPERRPQRRPVRERRRPAIAGPDRDQGWINARRWNVPDPTEADSKQPIPMWSMLASMPKVRKRVPSGSLNPTLAIHPDTNEDLAPPAGMLLDDRDVQPVGANGDRRGL